MNPLIAWFLGTASLVPTTPVFKKKGGHDKSNLPHGYPGAKLARKAVMGRIGRIHHGLHASFTSTRHAKSKGI